MNNKIQQMLRTFSILLAIVIVLTTGCQQQRDHSKELKPILDKGVEIWNTGNFEEVDKVWDSGVVRSANELPEVKGIDGIKKVITSFRTAFPDLKLAIDEEIYAENKITIRWTVTGTNTGPGEMPPTGNKVNFWGISVLHLANGKLTKEFVAFDNRALMEQLGYTMAPPLKEAN
ncbi:MAG: ester cyclase [Ignavibacterium sp.]|nr:MAG: ester cyclase [Ignavibacterium sp.]